MNSGPFECCTATAMSLPSFPQTLSCPLGSSGNAGYIGNVPCPIIVWKSWLRLALIGRRDSKGDRVPCSWALVTPSGRDKNGSRVRSVSPPRIHTRIGTVLDREPVALNHRCFGHPSVYLSTIKGRMHYVV